jgi:hypothetical protein
MLIVRFHWRSPGLTVMSQIPFVRFDPNQFPYTKSSLKNSQYNKLPALAVELASNGHED